MHRTPGSRAFPGLMRHKRLTAAQAATQRDDLGASSGGIWPVAFGGTGLSSLTAGRIPYGAGTSPFASSANLTFDGTNLTVGGYVQAGGSPDAYVALTPAAGGRTYRALSTGTGTSLTAGDATTIPAGSFAVVDVSTGNSILQYDSSTGNWGLGTNPDAYTLELYKSQNAGTINRANNPNTGTSAFAMHYATADVATIGIQAHAAARTATRYGIAFGGWAELIASAATGNGLMIGTGTANKPIIFGANSVEIVRMHPSKGVSFGSTTDPGGGNISLASSVVPSFIMSSTAAVGWTSQIVFRAGATDKIGLVADLAAGAANNLNVWDFTGGGAVIARFGAGLGVGTTSEPGPGRIYINAADFLIRNKTTFTNGAGVAAGTLTNAPAAGNPTKWIAIDDNGTARYIPTW